MDVSNFWAAQITIDSDELFHNLVVAKINCLLFGSITKHKDLDRGYFFENSFFEENARLN